MSERWLKGGIKGFDNRKDGVAVNCNGKATNETDLDTKHLSGDVKESAGSTRYIPMLSSLPELEMDIWESPA